MHIALICHDFPPFAYGGVASSCFDLARNLVLEGVKVDVFCGSRSEASRQSDDGFRITCFPSQGLAPRLSFMLNNSYALVSRIAEADVDVVHAFSSFGFLVDLIKNRTKKPVLSNIHGVPHRAFSTFLFSPLTSWSLGDFASDFLGYPVSSILMKTTLRKSNYVVFPSLHCLADTLSSYRDSVSQFSIIPNGVDFESPYFRNTRPSSEESSSIVYCGRLTWIKGIVFLLKAFSMLAKKSKDATLEIIGWGPMGPYAQSLVSGLGLQRRVRFIGAVPRGRAIQEISNAAFLALPSLNENGPVVAYEAMGLAKPVVAFNFSFAREFIVDNYNGLLARQADPHDLADRMLTLLNDRDMIVRLGQNAHVYAKAKHNWSINVKKYVMIYTNLATN